VHDRFPVRHAARGRAVHAQAVGHGLCLLKLGYTCERMGQNRDAADYLKRSLQIFQELHLRHYEQRAREALANSGSV
jgi:hypothetical protein